MAADRRMISKRALQAELFGPPASDPPLPPRTAPAAAAAPVTPASPATSMSPASPAVTRRKGRSAAAGSNVPPGVQPLAAPAGLDVPALPHRA